jgi:predicted O-methyltransferase YrrM
MQMIKKFKTSNFVKFFFKLLNPYNLNVPPGHYYSPIPDNAEIEGDTRHLYNHENIFGINISMEKHLNYIKIFKEIINDIPFIDSPSINYRYYYNNGMYEHSSGSLLYCWIKYLKPKRIFEIGSGFSSALMLDMNDHYFVSNPIILKFIEPNPERLKKLLKQTDYSNIELIENKLEKIDFFSFKELDEGDILFIDSTHVSKFGSDVNTIIFNIFPLLKKGVYIHIHDIFFPFEYPIDWLKKGVFWNEIYLLKAFLMFNNSFEIEFMNTYALSKLPEQMDEIPLFNKSTGGCLWIKKIK